MLQGRGLEIEGRSKKILVDRLLAPAGTPPGAAEGDAPARNAAEGDTAAIAETNTPARNAAEGDAQLLALIQAEQKRQAPVYSAVDAAWWISTPGRLTCKYLGGHQAGKKRDVLIQKLFLSKTGSLQLQVIDSSDASQTKTYLLAKSGRHRRSCRMRTTFFWRSRPSDSTMTYALLLKTRCASGLSWRSLLDKTLATLLRLTGAAPSRSSLTRARCEAFIPIHTGTGVCTKTGRSSSYFGQMRCRRFFVGFWSFGSCLEGLFPLSFGIYMYIYLYIIIFFYFLSSSRVV